MQLGMAPGNETAIVPDEAVSVVEGDHRHGVFLAAKYCRFAWYDRLEPTGGSPSSLILQITVYDIQGYEISQYA
jgi:hypothetical protein